MDKDETKIVKWWQCRRLSKRGLWKPERFTEGQRKNMVKYYEVRGPFKTKEDAATNQPNKRKGEK